MTEDPLALARGLRLLSLVIALGVALLILALILDWLTS